MSDSPSLAVRLYGTDESVEPPRLLAAGPLTAELEAGNLRYVRWRGVEVMRAVSFIVRDRNWATYDPEITGLVVEESGDGFSVRYTAVARDAKQTFRYEAEISGSADGRLVFRGRGAAEGDFVTNRTGFVVLHPAGAAGGPATIEHVDGRVVDTAFPVVIDPVQPMMDLRAITHAPATGLTVTCRMEGEAYEMEDQRNWTDASYKTYVRPLAKPWPYTLADGESVEQSVSLTIGGDVAAPAAAAGAVEISLGAAIGPLPALGIGCEPEHLAAARGHVALLAQAAPRHLICRHDPRRGHGRDTLAAAVDLARAIGATPWLEAVVAAVDGFAEEVAALGETVAALGRPFATVLVSPAPDLKCTLPGSPWPPCPPAAALYAAARAAFPGARLGGGMFSYFTELNRKRPPQGALDLVSFTTSALVHAGDDRSVMESLQALPYIAASVGEIAGATPWAVGPSAIGMRDNPYGAAPMDNPRNVRQAMNRNDPRQQGLLGAAWNLAYFTQVAAGGASAVALGAAAGPLGLVHEPASWPQPWYDEHGGVRPVFHVVRGMARLAGRPARALGGLDAGLAGLAVARGEGTEIWLANLRPETRAVRLPAPPAAGYVLDADRFVEAAGDASAFDRAVPLTGDRLDLGGFAVARLLLV